MLELDRSVSRAEFVPRAAIWGLEQAAHLGLFRRDQPPTLAKLEEAAALFSSKSLMPVAAMLSAAHPYALDYLKQCPMLALAVMDGHNVSQAKKRHLILTQWCALMRNGISLDMLMRMFQLPKPVRKLRAKALAPKDFPVIQQLARQTDASTLSQMIPAKNQTRWLQGLSAYMGTAAYKLHLRGAQPVPFLAWFGQNTNRHLLPSNSQCGADMADYVAAHLTSFNERWDWDGAYRRMREWETTASPRAVSNLEVNPYPFWPSLEVNGHEFVALKSGVELKEEGDAMSHCVASYQRELYDGMSRIISVRREGKRVATLEFRATVMEGNYSADDAATGRVFAWRFAQAKARFNARPDEPASKAIHAYQALWLKRQNDLGKKGRLGAVPVERPMLPGDPLP